MDTAKCHALLRVLETGSVRKTAAELGYTPSGISRMLQALENDLGIRLLNRSKTGVAPTPECDQSR